MVVTPGMPENLLLTFQTSLFPFLGLPGFCGLALDFDISGDLAREKDQSLLLCDLHTSISSGLYF